MYEDKFIGFIDVLGFKDMVEESERGEGRSPEEIFEILSELEHRSNVDFISKSGPKICPASPRNQQDLKFEVTQISDCAIVSAEISPAGLINLVNHCWGAVITLLTKGVMMRGYITRGMIVHEGNKLIGTGYQEAYSKEGAIGAFKTEADEKGTPFVEVDQSVLDYVESQSDECVKKMFDRMVESDGSVSSLYPFKSFAHSFIIGDTLGRKFDPERERKNNDNERKYIKKLISQIKEAVDESNPGAVKKTQYYVRALERQLDVADRTDDVLDKLSEPFGRT